MLREEELSSQVNLVTMLALYIGHSCYKYNWQWPIINWKVIAILDVQTCKLVETGINVLVNPTSDNL